MRLAGWKEGNGRMSEHRMETGPESPVAPTSTPPARKSPNRRELLALSGVAVIGTAHAQGPPQAVDPASPQIGILLATTYTTGTIESRLDEAQAHGLACAQLSMACAGLPDMPDEMPEGLPEKFRREAEARGLKIASLQGTFNMCHPDPEHRRMGLRRLRVLAEACPRMGTSAIHLCTGTRDRNSMWRHHPENNSPQAWRDMANCIREAAAIAQQAKVVLAFEPEVNNVVDTARKARQLLDEVGSPHLKVTIDPANIFHAGELPRMREVLEEAFALVGKDVVLAHAKDLDHDGDAGHKAAGEGLLDYDLYLRLLCANRFNGPLLLHGLSRAQVPGCVAFLRAKLARVAGQSVGRR
ncbi:MAG: sugar phosphate isomerase/epimerase family protein [Bryobacterales bacterium]|nr:sugar phosphate isomerase/epimerase family protein [Bryobacterales bacterium]